MRPVATSVTIVVAQAQLTHWVTMMSSRRGRRSMTTPASGLSSSTGKNWSTLTTEKSSAEEVRVSTSHAWAIVCIQVPVTEINCPEK